MILSSRTNVTYLLMEIIKNYFLNLQLYGIVVLYDYPMQTSFNEEYLHGLENALTVLSSNYQITLQWIRIDWANEIDHDESNNEYIIDLLHQDIETGSESPHPDLYRESNSSGPKTIFYDGSEGRIITNFCLLRNCSLEMYISDGWGSVETENRTGSGQFGAVYLHQADIAVASIGQWYFNVFDTSSAIARSACTLLVPAPRPLPYALTPILPFDKGTWTLSIISLIICVICYYLVKVYSELLVQKNERLGVVTIRKDVKTSFWKTTLEIIAVFSLQGINVGSNKIAVRILYGILLFAAITLENAYSGELKSNLTHPKLVGRIDTIHNFVETNYFWGAPHPAFAAPVRMSQVRDSMLMYKRVQIRSIEYLHNMTFSGTYGVAVERLHSGSITFGNYITVDTLDHLSILKDDLFYEYTMAIAIRGWPYMERFNKLALETLQHGLFVHWETEITDTYLDLAIETKLRQLVAGYEEPKVPKVLQIAHITGPLIMLAIGDICALIFFFGEHLWFRYKNRINPIIDVIE